METRPQLKVSSDRLVKPGIEPMATGLHGEQFINYTTADPLDPDQMPMNICLQNVIFKFK